MTIMDGHEHHRAVTEDDLQAMVDGQLPADRQALVNAFLLTDPIAARKVEILKQQRAALRAALAAKAAEPIPDRLRIANIVRAREQLRGDTPFNLRAGWMRVAAAIGWMMIGGGGTLLLSQPLGVSVPDVAASQAGLALGPDATLAHRTYVVDSRRPVELTATQEPAMVRWLSTRLSRRLTPPDLSTFGLNLVGGRVLPASAGPAAQLMYETSEGKRLTIYLRGTDEKTDPGIEFRFAHEGELNAFYWIDRGYSYAVLAPFGQDKLHDIALAVFDSMNADMDATAKQGSGPGE